MTIKDIVYLILPILLIVDISIRSIIYYLDKNLKKDNETILSEMKKSITVFNDIQNFIISKLKENEEEG